MGRNWLEIVGIIWEKDRGNWFEMGKGRERTERVWERQDVGSRKLGGKDSYVF